MSKENTKYEISYEKMLDFSKDYILENDTVRLSPLQKEHVKELSVQSNDPDIWTYLLEKGRSFNCVYFCIVYLYLVWFVMLLLTLISIYSIPFNNLLLT